MAIYAVIKDNKVIDRVVWDGKTLWNPGEGDAFIKTDIACLGDIYKDGKFYFIDNNDPENPKEIKRI